MLESVAKLKLSMKLRKYRPEYRFELLRLAEADFESASILLKAALPAEKFQKLSGIPKPVDFKL